MTIPASASPVMGTKTIEQALNWAHTADPNAKLYYNDYNDETMNSKSDAIYAMAQDFKTRGVPLDGIGFQFHVDLTFDNPGILASVTSNFQRFAALGLEIHITELDIRLRGFHRSIVGCSSQTLRRTCRHLRATA